MKMERGICFPKRIKGPLEIQQELNISKEHNVTLKIGDVVTLHTVNVSTIRGVDINEVPVFYKTEENLETKHQEWPTNYEKKKRNTFKENKARMDADYESLPDNFKKRIDRFRKNNPKFRIDFEEYELFCCKEALKIAKAFKNRWEIAKFKDDLLWEQQIREVPDLSSDHSGNTFNCACMLASLHLECPDMVPKMHGSLSPLVGSKDFGDINVDLKIRHKSTIEKSHCL